MASVYFNGLESAEVVEVEFVSMQGETRRLKLLLSFAYG
jgi:hypothetical protein